ncbi:MAG TPA: hypothetical protein PLO59_02785, partial [Bacteroidia bacterium]|nr:hypothetical protein [Bacteroidia bacterium]
MLPNNKTLFLITIFWICCNHTNAQTITDTCQQSDLPSVLFKNRTKETNSNDRFAMLLLPIIGSTPATGFFGGVGLQIVMRGSYVTDRYSSISGSMQFTAKRQKLLLAKNTVYLLHNKLFLMGDLRLLLFSQSTYGLGTNAPGKLQKALADLNGYSTNDDSLAQPMSYDYIKIHQTASWLIYPDLYVGGGFHIDKYQDINDIKLDTSSLSPRLTSHYLYNKIEGFNVNKYNLNGVSINAVFDS